MPWLNNSNDEIYKPIAQVGVTIDFIIDSKFNLLCSLKRKEKNNSNLNCGNFTNCDNSKYQYCIDDNIGLICKDGLTYGKNFYNYNKIYYRSRDCKS